MARVCFQLQVHPDRIAEYRERHAAVWPEMLAALSEAGWRDYSLFISPTGRVIGVLAEVGALSVIGGGSPAGAAEVLTLTSSAFQDNGTLAVKNACSDKQRTPNCIGENVSPPLAWANPPEGTKSYALLLFDPEGRAPAGVSHMVIYGIPAEVKGFAEGEITSTPYFVTRFEPSCASAITSPDDVGPTVATAP